MVPAFIDVSLLSTPRFSHPFPARVAFLGLMDPFPLVSIKAGHVDTGHVFIGLQTVVELAGLRIGSLAFNRLAEVGTPPGEMDRIDRPVPVDQTHQLFLPSASGTCSTLSRLQRSANVSRR